MLDQASELRQLVMHAAVDDALPGDGAPRLVALAGGKGGVGTTTVVTNIAAALARQGIAKQGEVRGTDMAGGAIVMLLVISYISK